MINWIRKILMLEKEFYKWIDDWVPSAKEFQKMQKRFDQAAKKY